MEDIKRRLAADGDEHKAPKVATVFHVTQAFCSHPDMLDGGVRTVAMEGVVLGCSMFDDKQRKD